MGKPDELVTIQFDRCHVDERDLEHVLEGRLRDILATMERPPFRRTVLEIVGRVAVAKAQMDRILAEFRVVDPKR